MKVYHAPHLITWRQLEQLTSEKKRANITIKTFQKLFRRYGKSFVSYKTKRLPYNLQNISRESETEMQFLTGFLKILPLFISLHNVTICVTHNNEGTAVKPNTLNPFW